MRILFSSLILISMSYQVCAQNRRLDSLYAVLATFNAPDTNRVNALLKVSTNEYAINPDKTKLNADEALLLSQNLNYKKGEGYAYRALGLFWWIKGDYDRAAEHAFKMLSIFEKLQLKEGLAQSYSLLGLIHDEWDNFEKAKYYFMKGAELNMEIQNKYNLGYSYNSLGSLYQGSSKYDSSLIYHHLALKLREEIKDWEGVSQSYNNIALIYMKREEYDEALDYYLKSLPISKRLNSRNRLAIIEQSLGEVYTFKKEYALAETHLNAALVIARDMGNKKIMKEAYRRFTQLEEKRGNFRQALVYERQNRAYEDSLFDEQKAKQIAELETRYETTKKEQTIQLLERDKKIESLIRNILIAILILTSIGAFVIFRIQRYRDRKNRELLNVKIDYLTVKHQELLESRQSVTDQGHLTIEGQDDRFLKKVLDVVERHISDPLFGVEKMADELAVSRANLLRKLKSVTGLPPSDFIRSVRLKRAAHLLRSQADTVARIGFMVGFEDQSYFAKSFRKHFGVSPTEYARSVAQPV
jgi:AraC-like DNA-binding protein/tetratricopeptide (TPR) repeat protein